MHEAAAGDRVKTLLLTSGVVTEKLYLRASLLIFSCV